jgi:iron complex outermembrane receptor protein
VRNARYWLAAGCALAALSAALPALAQPANTEQGKAAAVDESTNNSTVVEQVIVTTERRATNVQDTPLAVTAFTSQTRENLGIESIQSLAQFTPGVSYSAAADRPTIRGVGRQNNSHGLNSPVAQYIDGFYVSTTQDTARRPIFVDRNEVVAGPQGALAGKGSAAGAIYTYLKRPKDTFEADVGGLIENYDRWGLEGTITGPITDWLRYRINMARYKQEQGFFRNVEDGSTEGDRFGNRTLLDVMFAGNIGDKVDWFLKGSTVSYYESLHDGGSFAPLTSGGNNPCIQAPFNSTAQTVPSNVWGTFAAGSATSCGAFTTTSGATPANPAATIYGAGITQNPVFTFGAGARRDFISNYHSDLHLENYHLVSFDTTYHAPFMDIKYIVGSSRYHYTQSSDNDGSPVQTMVLPAATPTPLGGGFFLNSTAPRIVNANGVNIYQEEPSWYSNELTFTSTWKGPLQGIVGFYQYNQYTRQPTADLIYEGFPELATPYAIGLGATGPSFTPSGLAAPNVNGPMSQYGNQKTRQNTWAAFTQWDYKFSSKWSLTAGVRWNSDKERAYEETRFVANNPLLGAGATNVLYNGLGLPGIATISGPFALDVSSVFAPGFAVISPTGGAFPTLPPRYQLLDPASVPGVTNSPVPLTRCGSDATLLYTGVQLCSTDRIEFGPGVQYVSVDANGNRVREDKGKWGQLTGGFSLNFTPNEDTLVYLRYAKGYRPGGFGATTAGFLPLNPYADKETLDTYELGGKITLFNNLQINTDLFYYDYKDIQVQLSRFERCIDPTDISTCAAVSSVVNLPSGVNQGVEVEARWFPTSNLQLMLNYGYLDAHIKNGLTADGLGFQDTNDPAALLPGAAARRLVQLPTVDPITGQPNWTQDISGNELPNAPHHKVAANVSYTFHLGAGNLTASYSYLWRSSAYSQPDVFEEKIGRVPAYDQSDARLIFRQKDGDYQIILFGSNIFNQTTYESGGSTRRGSGYTPAQALACGGTCAQTQIYYPNFVLLPPRTFGIEFLKKFR